MLTGRDNEILNFIALHGGITIYQCAKMFFKKAKYGEDLARKRLKKLATEDILNYDQDWVTNQRVYFIKKKPSSHSLMLTNFYTELASLGAEIIEFNREYKLEGVCRPDGFIVFTYNNKAKLAFIEIDMQHKTNIDKYEKLFDTNLFQNEYGTFPQLIIISTSKEYKTDYPISIKILDYSLKDLREKVLKF